MNNTFPCDITYIETGRYDSLAMVLPHKSPYTGILNHQLTIFILMLKMKNIFIYKCIIFNDKIIIVLGFINSEIEEY